MKSALLLALGLGLAGVAGAEVAPATLGDTGLYVDGTLQLRPDVVPFAPQYPLWSDAARKRRWIRLPPRGQQTGDPKQCDTFGNAR
jgi:hypothetical protein